MKRNLDAEQVAVERLLKDVGEDTWAVAMEKLPEYGLSWRWSTQSHMLDRLLGERKEVDEADTDAKLLHELLDEIWTATMLYDLVKNGRKTTYAEAIDRSGK